VNPKLAAGGWLAGALGLAASPVIAGAISGSAHDFSISAWSGGKICVACHIPRNAMTNVTAAAPLWNHTITAQVYTVYSSNTLKTIRRQPMGLSKLCLSCHDGTVAVDSYNGTAGMAYISAENKLETNLNVHHPSSVLYDTALATANGSFFDPAIKVVTIGRGAQSKTGTIASLMLYSGQVECSTCHDVHNTFTATTTGLLKVSMSRSAICFTCHNY
jgi:predicted CXXCH cytochrome family protein